jgi:hypothetical protein
MIEQLIIRAANIMTLICEISASVSTTNKVRAEGKDTSSETIRIKSRVKRTKKSPMMFA